MSKKRFGLTFENCYGKSQKEYSWIAYSPKRKEPSMKELVITDNNTCNSVEAALFDNEFVGVEFNTGKYFIHKEVCDSYFIKNHNTSFEVNSSYIIRCGTLYAFKSLKKLYKWVAEGYENE